MSTPTNNPNNYTADELGTAQPWEFDADAVVYEFMTAGGANTPDAVSEMLEDDPKGTAALAEMRAEWTLWCELDGLADAMAQFIASRPDLEAD